MDALNIAKYFLYKANLEGDLITNLKMQKLLYYAQAWYLVNFKNRVLFDDVIEAWDFGPVIPSVYHHFKEYRHTPIDYKSSPNSIFKKVQGEEKEYLDEFYDKFINFSAHDLVNMSHNEEPWEIAFKNSIKVIDIDNIRKYYSDLYKKRTKAKN